MLGAGAHVVAECKGYVVVKATAVKRKRKAYSHESMGADYFVPAELEFHAAKGRICPCTRTRVLEQDVWNHRFRISSTRHAALGSLLLRSRALCAPITCRCRHMPAPRVKRDRPRTGPPTNRRRHRSGRKSPGDTRHHKPNARSTPPSKSDSGRRELARRSLASRRRTARHTDHDLFSSASSRSDKSPPVPCVQPSPCFKL